MLSKIYPFKLCTSVVQLQLHKSIQTSAGICGRHSAAVCAPQMQYIEIRDPERNGHIIKKYTTEPCELSQKLQIECKLSIRYALNRDVKQKLT